MNNDHFFKNHYVARAELALMRGFKVRSYRWRLITRVIVNTMITAPHIDGPREAPLAPLCSRAQLANRLLVGFKASQPIVVRGERNSLFRVKKLNSLGGFFPPSLGACFAGYLYDRQRYSVQQSRTGLCRRFFTITESVSLLPAANFLIVQKFIVFLRELFVSVQQLENSEMYMLQQRTTSV